MRAAMQAAFDIPGPIARVTMTGRTDRAIAEDMFRIHTIENTADNWSTFRSHYLRLLPEYLADRNGQVLPGIEALLDRLANDEDTAVGLLTGNLYEGAKRKLGHFGLMQHFPFGGFGDQHTSRDDVAREALAQTRRAVNSGVEPADISVIGDTPLDVQCARAIGARAIAVATGTHTIAELIPAEPDLLLESLADPPAELFAPSGSGPR